jgi:hypothetical protein
MVVTVQRVKRPFVDVFVEQLFEKDSKYPLTYVPVFGMVLPLKKGQKVWVKFEQDNPRYPVLWKLAGGFDEESDFVKEQFELPASGDVIKFPGVDDTAEVYKYSDDFWLIVTKSYVVFHREDQVEIFDADGVLVGCQDFRVLTTGSVTLETPAGTLGQAFKSLVDILSNLTTTGGPAAQSISPASRAELSLFEQRFIGGVSAPSKSPSVEGFK